MSSKPKELLNKVFELQSALLDNSIIESLDINVFRDSIESFILHIQHEWFEEKIKCNLINDVMVCTPISRNQTYFEPNYSSWDIENHFINAHLFNKMSRTIWEKFPNIFIRNAPLSNPLKCIIQIGDTSTNIEWDIKHQCMKYTFKGI